MTEEDAKKRWCPMARVTTMRYGKGYVIGGNRDVSLLVPPNSFDPDTDITKCIASACMMWREELDVEKNGYCGLGGKP